MPGGSKGHTFTYMFLLCHVGVLEWIHTLQMPECQGTPCSISKV